MPDGTELRRIRQSAGLSRAQLARAADVSDRTVKRAEDGEKIRRETQFRIVHGLNDLSKHDPPYELEDVFPDEAS